MIYSKKPKLFFYIHESFGELFTSWMMFYKQSFNCVISVPNELKETVLASAYPKFYGQKLISTNPNSLTNALGSEKPDILFLHKTLNEINALNNMDKSLTLFNAMQNC